jgi:uncharacterized protein (DUF3820 family)
MKIDINLYTTRHGIRCFINNFNQLDDTTIEHISKFANSRNGGYFRYDLAEFGMQKKYSKEYLLKILHEYGFDTEIIEPQQIEDRVLNVLTNINTKYDPKLLDCEVGFGKYKSRLWEDLPEHYLYWLIESFDDFKAEFAYYELKRRGVEIFKSTPLEDRLVDFGKYQGSTWQEIPKDYLIWLSRNYDDDRQKLAITELKRRENNPIAQEDTKQLDRIKKESISFGKYKGTKWCDIDDSYLEWLVNNFNNEDVVKLAKLVLKSRENGN